MNVFIMSIVVLVVIFTLVGVRVVPQQTAYVVERLGKFYKVLEAGINFIIPFFDRVAYKHTLKEQAIDIPEQVCITKDNVRVEVDGIVFVKVVDPVKASYGINNYIFAITQLSQTTMRSEIGKIDLDKTFEERTAINSAVVSAIDEAAGAWGIKVLRYEIKNITPPETVLKAMEKQMQAEREKRAMILQSEGERQSAINIADGEKQKLILESEGAKQRQINEAMGQAEAIKAIAHATAQGIMAVAEAIGHKNGIDAVQLRVAEKLVEQFGYLAKATNTLILPANFGDMASMLAAALSIVRSENQLTGKT